MFIHCTYNVDQKPNVQRTCISIYQLSTNTGNKHQFYVISSSFGYTGRCLLDVHSTSVERIILNIDETFNVRLIYISRYVQRTITLHRIGADNHFLWICSGCPRMSLGRLIHPSWMFNGRSMVVMFCVGSIISVSNLYQISVYTGIIRDLIRI